jgi:hypothetical protein
MVPIQFFAQNAHFAVSLFAALASFAVFWLVFDAWTERRKPLEAIKWAGFGLLAVAFLIGAATLEQRDNIPGDLAARVAAIGVALRILAYFLIALAQLLDPLQQRPHYENELAEEPKPKVKAHGWLAVGTVSKLVLLPVLPFVVAALYLRRATTGLERHLRPVAFAFAWIGLYELLSVPLIWQNTTNPLLYRLVAAYGPLWWLAQAALLVGAILLARWVWAYLTKRLFSELFMVLVTSTVLIYFISTVGFSFLLLRNIKSEALGNLSTASRVLEYAVASRQAEAAAQAETAGQNPAVVARDHKALAAALSDYLAAHSLSSLVLTDDSGQVLLRAEDPARWGDSLSSDSLVGRALVGDAAKSVVVQSGVIAPSVVLVAARPIRDAAGAVIGTVSAGRAISNGFVDGVKTATALDSTVYGGNVRSATTLVTADGTTRAVGVQETSDAVKTTVLKQGKSYAGTVAEQHRSYLAAYIPLKDADSSTVAMVLVSRPEDELLALAGRTVQLTFLMAIALLVISILPIYLIARRLARQMH